VVELRDNRGNKKMQMATAVSSFYTAHDIVEAFGLVENMIWVVRHWLSRQGSQTKVGKMEVLLGCWKTPTGCPKESSVR
jgi:hypothetical protein